MEKITRRYRQLFAVEILHHLLLDEGDKVYDGQNDLSPSRKQQFLRRYQLHEWMRVEPDSATQRTMTGVGLVLKKTPTGFVVAVEVRADDDRKSRAGLGGVSLLFLLRLNPDMAGRTALPLVREQEGKPVAYVFGNEEARNRLGAYPFLNRPTPVFANADTYVPGDVVRAGTKQFVALTKSQGNPTSQAAFWRETDGRLAYASRRDLREVPEGSPAGVLGWVEIKGKAGLDNYSVLAVADEIKLNQVFRLHLDKL
jgi:hypothetical protein